MLTVITILLFISLSNCPGTKSKTLFFKEFKCHLRIDWVQDCHLYILYIIKILYCHWRLKKISFWSRGFCILTDLFVQWNNIWALQVWEILTFEWRVVMSLYILCTIKFHFFPLTSINKRLFGRVFLYLHNDFLVICITIILINR